MAHHSTCEFVPARVAVLTVSDTRTAQTDKSGAIICDLLAGAGHVVISKDIVVDDLFQIRAGVSQLLADGLCEFIILTGGTGLRSRDVTPQAIAPLYTAPIPGFGELFRMLSYQDIGSSTIQSRAEAGLCGDTVVFALPGSTGACRMGMEKIILEQIDNTHRPCNFREVVSARTPIKSSEGNPSD